MKDIKEGFCAVLRGALVRPHVGSTYLTTLVVNVLCNQPDATAVVGLRQNFKS